MPKRHPSDTRAGRLVLLAVALGALVVAACNEGGGATPCLTEDVERCTCDDGREGFQVCGVDGGSGYGACNCDLDASPYLPEAGEPDAGEPGEGGDEEASSGLPFMSACSTASGSPPCAPGTSCDDFPAKGPHCSKPCSVATDCPAPSPGCSMMGVCKAP